MQPKRLRQIIMISCCLLLLPFTVAAEEDIKERGQMDWKIDRVTEDESINKRGSEETTLEKTLPDLFAKDTHATIQAIQKKHQESLEELEKTIFTTDLDGDTTIADTKESLFDSDYVVPERSKQEQQDNKRNSWLNYALMIGLVGLAVIVGTGIYMLVQRQNGWE